MLETVLRPLPHSLHKGVSRELQKDCWKHCRSDRGQFAKDEKNNECFSKLVEPLVIEVDLRKSTDKAIMVKNKAGRLNALRVTVDGLLQKMIMF